MRWRNKVIKVTLVTTGSFHLFRKWRGCGASTSGWRASCQWSVHTFSTSVTSGDCRCVSSTSWTPALLHTWLLLPRRHFLLVLSYQEHAQAQRELWMMEDILSGLKINRDHFRFLLGLQRHHSERLLRHTAVFKTLGPVDEFSQGSQWG